jgi:hypothetical protein
MRQQAAQGSLLQAACTSKQPMQAVFSRNQVKN